MDPNQTFYLGTERTAAKKIVPLRPVLSRPAGIESARSERRENGRQTDTKNHGTNSPNVYTVQHTQSFLPLFCFQYPYVEHWSGFWNLQ